MQVLLLGCYVPVALLAQSPTGGTVVGGSSVATISQSGSTTNINQSVNSAVINWTSFSIGASSVVNFNQPGVTSVTLNRVTGDASSVIDGVLNATGNVFLINANGILMNSTARISTGGGFVASTLGISDADFNAGKYSFASSNSKANSVINLGTISTTKDGGYVALLGGGLVSNQGVITATKGTVALAAGDQITLNFNGNSLVGVTVGEGALNALVENKQAIYANGGTVILTAKAADDLISAQVNNSGLIQARTVGDLKGNILLEADGGTVNIGGTLDASALSGDGGQIVTTGTSVNVVDGASIITQSASGNGGLWTISSYGFSVASSGGNMTATELNQALDTTSVKISSPTASSNGVDSSVSINAPVSWTGNTSLTLSAADYVAVNKSMTSTGADAQLNLNAGRDVEVNAPVSLSGSNAVLAMQAGNNIDINDAVTLSGDKAALAMNYGGDYNILTSASFAGAVLNDNGIPEANVDTSKGTYGSITLSGSNASLSMNGKAYTLIHSISQLDELDGLDAATGQGTSSTVSGLYALAGNLDASGTTYSSSLIDSFTGTFAGLGHTINNLSINAPTQNFVGLFGSASNATLRDIGLTNVNINAGYGYYGVGALLGSGSGTTIQGDYSTGKVSAYRTAGGLVGSLSKSSAGDSKVTYSYSSADVTATSSLSENQGGGGCTGGLVGCGNNISNSSATGTVTAVNGYAGGLVGSGTNIDLSYATGAVKETTANTDDMYASGVGGLTGYSSGNITNSFATGNVSGENQVGGLIGFQNGGANWVTPPYYVKNSWASGNVTSYGSTPTANAGDYVGYIASGGLIGASDGTNIIDCFATGNVTSYYYESTSATAQYQNTVGGLVGELYGGSVSGSYATGNVTTVTDNFASSITGGLVGLVDVGSVENSFAYGNVSGGEIVGGLVGELYNYGGELGGTYSSASISDSAAYGNVSGTTYVGGVVGYVYGGTANDGTAVSATVSNVASFGDVTASGGYVGGIAGYSNENGAIDNSTVYGSVQGADNVGSIVGNNGGTVTNSESLGKTKSNVTDAELSKTVTTAANVQSSSFVSKNTEDRAQASGDLGDQVQDNILIDDPSRFSATVKTVIVDGVEYQVQEDSDSKKSEKEEGTKKSK